MSEPNANDEFRAFQAALVTMATQLAIQHGLNPSEVGVTVHLRLPPEARLIQVQVLVPEMS